MSWRDSAWWEESTQFACCRNPECQPWSSVLDSYQRRGSAWHACVVEIARTAALAVGDLYQIDGHRVFGRSGPHSEKAVTEQTVATRQGQYCYRPALAASFKIIASRIPACANRSSTTEAAWSR